MLRWLTFARKFTRIVCMPWNYSRNEAATWKKTFKFPIIPKIFNIGIPEFFELINGLCTGIVPVDLLISIH